MSVRAELATAENPHRRPWCNTPHFYALVFGRAAIRRMIGDFALGAEDRIHGCARLAASYAAMVLDRSPQ